MQKQSVTGNAKQLLATAAAVSILLFGSTQAIGARYKTDKLKKASPVQISFLGLKDDRVMFEVLYQNKEQQRFALEILNESNEVLYSKNYSDTAFSRKIILDKQSEEEIVTISVRCGKKLYSETFKIRPQSSYINELLVARQ
jgi:hypothetical protein